MSPWFWRVWYGLSRPGKCYKCRRPILWVITDRNRRVPLEAEAQPIRVDVDADTSARFAVYAGETLHSRSCTGRKSR